jgi:hypothetical protein
VVSKKQLTLGEGEAAFNYPIPKPDETLGLLFDLEKFDKKIKNADGTPNVQKQLLLAAIMDDDQVFLSEYAKHHQMIGAKNAIAPIENASGSTSTPARDGNQPLDPAAEMARSGKIVSG